MNALLSLEPRIAGDTTMEPDIDFADDRDELHGANFCIVGTTTYYCGDTTHICLA